MPEIRGGRRRSSASAHVEKCSRMAAAPPSTQTQPITRSGEAAANQSATEAPQLWPATITRSKPAASHSPPRSPATSANE